MKLSRAWFALSAAVLFGASTPAAKFMVGKLDSLMLASLLYLGAGIGLTIIWALAAAMNTSLDRTFRFKNRFETGCFAGAIFSGGVVAPILLVFGLTRISASAASLLLNLEAAFTVLLAVLIFHERYGRRLVLGLILILAGSGLLSWLERERGGNSLVGALAIIGACGCWAIDNNLTRQVGSVGALPLAACKGIVAGGVNLLLALAAGNRLPAAGAALASSVVGFFGYGLSLVLFISSLRRIGVARTSAYFSTAPFLGAMLSILILGDAVSASLAASGVLMAVGVWLHLTEKV